MNVLPFSMRGRCVRSDNFVVIISVMLAVAGAAADIVVRASAVAGLFKADLGGFTNLYVAASVVTAIGALAFSAMLLVARTGRMGSLPLFIPASVVSVGLLLNMIFSLLLRGTPHMNAEVLIFVFSVVAALATGLTSAGFAKPYKAVILTGAMSVLSVVAAFVPYFTGDFKIAESLACLPFSVMLGAYAFALAGFGELPKESGEDK